MAAGGEEPPVSMTAFEARQRVRDDLAQVRSRLVAEFAFRLPADTVVRQVGHVRQELVGRGVRAGLPQAVEGVARQRLLLLQVGAASRS
jgi:hypothetical protein